MKDANLMQITIETNAGARAEGVARCLKAALPATASCRIETYALGTRLPTVEDGRIAFLDLKPDYTDGGPDPADVVVRIVPSGTA